MREIENIGTRIQCATACFKETDCKGFGYDIDKTCSLFGIFTDKGFCSNENCLYKKGIGVYMVSSTHFSS